MKDSSTHLQPPPGYRFRPAWYTRPWFYLPLAAVLVLILIGTVFFFMQSSELRDEAATFDLTKLDQMESASVIVDRNGKMFGQIYVENRETVPYDQLPRDLINAVVAVEDSKFYQHHGYDLFGIIRAALKNAVAGHVRQGASTVTQQLARNTFSLKERTFHRKVLEIFLSRRIEDRLGKQKIMELYLNRIYFGGGLYGAEAAARGYFGKQARDLTLAECATLAGLIKSPNRLSPWTDPAGSREARNYALNRMRDLEFITRQKWAAATQEELVVGNRQNAQGQTYAVDYIRQKVIEAVGWDRAMNEGFRIHTTIDADLQKIAEESLRRSLDHAEQFPGYNHQTYAQYAGNFKKLTGSAASQPPPEYLQGAVIGINNETGGIMVLVGGRDFEHNQYDRALQAKRPVGTAMLPFVYAAAFEDSMFPGSVVEDSPLDNRAVMIGGTTGILGEWGPETEENRYEGTITAREALSKSKNGATVRIGMDAGLDPLLQLCKNAGIRAPLRPYPATFLGSSEVTLADLVMAYTIFPNGGWRPTTLHILERIEEKDGSVVWDAKKEQQPKQNVIKPETAFEVHSCLVDALVSGTGKAARPQFGLKKFPAAGKTGTAYDFTDALFAGYDSNFTCAIWAGFDKPQKIYRGAFGRELALPVWVDIMNAAAEHYPAEEIKQPAGLQRVEICSRSGLLATDKCYDSIKGPSGDVVQKRTTYMEIATAAQKPTELCNVHGEPRTRLVRETASEGDLPKAQLAVDVKEVTPVIVKTPTLLANKDPYNSVKPVIKPEPERPPEEPVAQQPQNQPVPGEKIENGNPQHLLTPQPVRPLDDKSMEIRKAIPVGPSEDELGNTLLKNQTSPTPSPDEESDD